MCAGYIIPISNLKPIDPYKFNYFPAEADKPQIYCVISYYAQEVESGSSVFTFPHPWLLKGSQD